MAEPPSLISLCIDALAQQLIRGDDDVLLQAVYDFPFHLIETLSMRLPPFTLHKLHQHMPFQDQSEEGFLQDDLTNKRKRARVWNLNAAWKKLFKLRWPHLIKQIQPMDWLQEYWETHLQDCLDEAAEIALLPSFNGFIGDIQISDGVSGLKYDREQPLIKFVEQSVEESQKGGKRDWMVYLNCNQDHLEESTGLSNTSTAVDIVQCIISPLSYSVIPLAEPGN
ncbi:hypothetical protein SESBI_40133 [Sesbania bispinosa]|nr:hypothetical protein SESBI_40133 [Sesbania bispinosa]